MIIKLYLLFTTSAFVPAKETFETLKDSVIVLTGKFQIQPLEL